MDKRINIWINGKEVENNIKSIRSSMIHLTNQLNKMEIGSEEYIQTSKKLRDLKAIYDEHCKSLKMTNQEIENNTASWKKNIIHWGAFAAAAQGASAAVQRFIASTQEYVDAYASLDDAMSAVQKTTGMTREEVEQLHESLKGIDTRTSTEELLKIAEIGGRMGLAKEQIRDFTEAVNKANVALGDSFQGGAEEISSVLGKIALAYKETRDQNIGEALTQIGSALNEVGASANATESNIASFVQRVGSMPEAFRPTVQQAVALGAAFEESSIEAEVASRAFGIVMTKAASNVEQFASVMQRPAEEIRELINTNPAQFFVEFAESLQGLEATDVASILKDLKLNADGVNKIIGAMSTNSERFAEILTTSNTAFEEAISLDKEYATVNENSAAQLEKAKKAVQDAKAALGEELIPVITQLIESSASGLKVITTAIQFIKEHKVLIGSLAAAYGLLYAAHMKEVHAKQLSSKWTKIISAGESAGTTITSLFALAKAKLAKNTLAAANAQKAFKVAFAATPWGAIITAVTTLATAFIFMRDKTDEAAEARQDLEVQIRQQYNTEKKKVEELQAIIESENATREQKLKAINTLKSLIPDYVAELDKEGKVVNNNRKAIDNYLVSLKNKIRYQSLEKGLNDTENKILEAEVRLENAQKEYDNQGLFGALFGGQKKLDEAKKNLAEAKSIRKGYLDEMQQMNIDLISQTGKTYEELYQKYDENILGNLGNNGSGTGDGGTKKPKKDPIADFEKRLQEFRTRQQRETLEGWAKTKQEIVDTYQKWIDEAKEKYGENSDLFKSVSEQLTNEMNADIAAAGQKWLKNASETLQKATEDADKLLRESMPDNGESPLMKAIAGEQSKWDEIYSTLNENIDTYIAMLNDPKLSQQDISLYQGALQKSEEALADATQKNAMAISNIIQQHTKTDTDFITGKEKELARSRMTEHDRRVAEIKEEYQLRIEAKQKEIAVIEQLLKNNPENADYAKQIEELKEVIEKLEALQDEEIAAVPTGNGQTSVWTQLRDFDWSDMSTNWQDGLNLMTQGLQEFANAAFDIYGSINQIMANATEAEVQRTEELYDSKSAALKRQLDSGLISQKRYDAQMEQLQKEKEKKEKKLKHDEFERERAANLIQGAINLALTISSIYANEPGGVIIKSAAAAVAAAIQAVQIAAIASQPNPYAKGGYIKSKQYAVMGEQGPEWVASNKLLKDEKTKDIVAALDEYQQGNTRALERLTMPAPDLKTVSQSVRRTGGNFAPSNQITNIYNQDTGNDEMLQELKKLNGYMSDPMNRRSYISREIQLEFEAQEREVREMARL